MKIATQGGDGKIAFASESVRITCTDALSAGDVVKLTLGSDGTYSACTQTAATNTDDVVLTGFGVALDAVDAGAIGRIGLRGVFNVKCSGDVAAGNALTIDDGVAGTLHEIPTVATGSAELTEYARVVGIALTADGAAAAGSGKAVVQFDGLAATFIPAKAQA
jgi:predicted RecA/RadA family phage recombinase